MPSTGPEAERPRCQKDARPEEPEDSWGQGGGGGGCRESCFARGLFKDITGGRGGTLCECLAWQAGGSDPFSRLGLLEPWVWMSQQRKNSKERRAEGLRAISSLRDTAPRQSFPVT